MTARSESRQQITADLQRLFGDMAESVAVATAKEYSDIEPLLVLLEKHGLTDPAARKMVADAARGKSLLKRGQQPKSFEDEHRNHLICAQVANQRGLLERESRDVRRAFRMVAESLQQRGGGLDAKQVKRIWESRSRTALDRLSHVKGREGQVLLLKPDT